jgi:hypothetical protein
MDDKLLALFGDYKIASQKREAYYKEIDEMDARRKELDNQREVVDKEFDEAYRNFRDYVFNNF